MGKGLLDLTGMPGKDPMLDKMAKIPPGYTHVGIANTEVGVTVVVAHPDFYRPLVFDPLKRDWAELKTKTAGGVLR